MEQRGDRVKKLFKRVAQQERKLLNQEFLTPYAPELKSAVVKVDGLAYKFRIVGFRGTGYGIFRPVDSSCAKFLREADDGLVRNYLTALPGINFILVCQTDRGWCGYPMNMESARKQIGLESEVIVKAVSDAERFDIVTARFDGLHFWFDELFPGGDPAKALKIRECFTDRHRNTSSMRSKFDGIAGIIPEERQAFNLALSSWEMFQKQTTEGRLKEFLARGGASLESYVIRGQNIEIRWSSGSGRRYNSLVNKNTLNVVSAGICLSGGDSRFHFKDLPGVINEGETRELIVVERDA